MLSFTFSVSGYYWQIKEVRPKVTLVVRMAASVANYDYIVDWEFQTDGLIRIKVSALVLISHKSSFFKEVHQVINYLYSLSASF